MSTSEDEKKDPDSVVGALEKYFTPKTNVVYERYVFGTTNQGTNETVDQYITRLRHLANLCKFEALLDDFICDRLVLGTNDNSARARMFREKDLTLDAAINICRVSELSQMQLKQIKKSESDIQFVKTSQRAKAKHQKHADKPEYRDCKYCGKSHKRGSNFCSAYGKRCSKCNKLHHFACVCQSRKGRKQPTNFSKNESGHSETDSSVLMIEHTLNNVKMTKKQLSVEIALSHEKDKRGVPIECLLDTGTTCNVLSIDDLNKISRNAVMRESQTRLNLYDGSYMRPLGLCTLHTVHKWKLKWSPQKLQENHFYLQMHVS